MRYYVEESICNRYSREHEVTNVTDFSDKEAADDYIDAHMTLAKMSNKEILEGFDAAYQDDEHMHVLNKYPAWHCDSAERHRLIEIKLDDDGEEDYRHDIAIFYGCPTHTEFLEVIREKFPDSKIDTVTNLVVQVGYDTRYEIAHYNEPVSILKFCVEAFKDAR